MSDVDLQIRCMRCGTQMEHAGSGPGHAVDAGPVLGVPQLRTALLDDVSAAEAQGGSRSRRQRLSGEPADGLLICVKLPHFA